MFLVYLIGGIVLVKFIVLAYIQWRQPWRMKDDSGPVSGWGTPKD